jgi:hypothetical protein
MDFMLYLVCDSVQLLGISPQDPQWQVNRVEPTPTSASSSSGVEQFWLTTVAFDATGLIVDRNGNIVVDTTDSFVAAPSTIVPSGSTGSTGSTGLNSSSSTGVAHQPTPPPDVITTFHSGGSSRSEDDVGWGLALALVLIFFCAVIGCFLYSCLSPSFTRSIRPSPVPVSGPGSVVIESQGPPPNLFAPVDLVPPTDEEDEDRPTKGPHVLTRGLGLAEKEMDRKRLVQEERPAPPTGAGEGKVIEKEARRPSTVGLTSAEAMVDVELEDGNADSSRRSSISGAPYDFKRFHDAV